MNSMISPADPIGAFNPIDAWLSLPHLQRDMIGVFALRFVFGGFVSEEVYAKEDRLLGEEVNQAGSREHDLAWRGLIQTVEKALPDVFGRDGEDPDWMVAAPALPGETDEQFLQRVVVEPLQDALDPQARAAEDAGWTRQDDGSWLRLAYDGEPSNCRFGNDRPTIHVGSAREALEWDGLAHAQPFAAPCDDRRTDREIAAAAIRGARGVFAPASMLVEA